ncbi:hypothetical protein FB107DRAFT_272845 [Schizophyllum commune]
MANYDFELDGNNAGNFHHDPENVTDYYYNIPVFSVADLDNDSHELVINVAGTRGIAGSSLMLFDYFTYTYDEDGTSSTASETPTPTSANAHPDDTPKSRTGPYFSCFAEEERMTTSCILTKAAALPALQRETRLSSRTPLLRIRL